MGIFSAVKRRIGGIGKTVDNYQEAIAFAEAGEHDHASSLITGSAAVTDEGRWLLVIGNQAAFPDKMMTYALEMADRLSYRIYALNAAPVPFDRRPSFETSAKESACAFQNLAREKGIDFSHDIRFTDADQAAEQVAKEVGNIDFIISDGLESSRLSDGIQPENRPVKELLVYSMS